MRSPRPWPQWGGYFEGEGEKGRERREGDLLKREREGGKKRRRKERGGSSPEVSLNRINNV